MFYEDLKLSFVFERDHVRDMSPFFTELIVCRRDAHAQYDLFTCLAKSFILLCNLQSSLTFSSTRNFTSCIENRNMVNSSSSSGSDSDSSVRLPKKKKWGFRNDDCYKQNVIKKSRIAGKAYVNYKGKHVPPKSMGENCE